MKFLHRPRVEVDMIQGSILKNLLRFSIPLMLTSILQLLYNAADLIMVSRFDRPESMASVGATSALINLIINIFMGLSIGTSVVVSQYYGAGRHKDIRESVHTSIALSVIMGVVVGIFGVFMSRSLLEAMSIQEKNVLDGAALYMRIYFLGMPGNMVYNFGAAILRAVGDTKRPLYYLTTAGIINIILNYVFVALFGLGVAGVAIATIVSQYISAVLVLLSLLRSHSSIRLFPREIRVYRDKLFAIAKIGLPAGLQGAIFSASNVLIQSSVNSFGFLAMAGNAAASNIENFVYTSMNSVYQGALAFTGQNVGAQRYSRINRILLTSVLLVLGFGVTLGGLSTLCSRPLLSIYIDEANSANSFEAMIAFGQLRMRIICTTYFLCGLMEVMVGTLRGMGYSLTPMIVATIGVCLVRVVWIYTIFAAHHTLETLCISYPISWLATTMVHFGCFLFVRRKLPKADAALADVGA